MCLQQHLEVHSIQLTVNVAVFVINFVAGCFSWWSPINSSLFIMGEFNYGHIGCSSSCHKEVYQRADDEATTGRTDPLITNIMWRNLLAQAFY